MKPTNVSASEKPLAGKVALITGGSRGIGAAIARRLPSDGANVAISYIASTEKAEVVVRELKAKGVQAVAFKADQAKPTEVSGLVKAVHARFGRLDILVNNAGALAWGVVGDPAADIAATNLRAPDSASLVARLPFQS